MNFSLSTVKQALVNRIGLANFRPCQFLVVSSRLASQKPKFKPKPGLASALKISERVKFFLLCCTVERLLYVLSDCVVVVVVVVVVIVDRRPSDFLLLLLKC